MAASIGYVLGKHEILHACTVKGQYEKDPNTVMICGFKENLETNEGGLRYLRPEGKYLTFLKGQ